MTKEEEVIEKLNRIKNIKLGPENRMGMIIEEFKSLQNDIETVLSMLKEKDKEIQFQKDINKQEKDRHKQAEKSMKGQIKKKDEELKMYKDIKEIANSKVTGLVKLKQYDDLKKKVDKQDKIINKSIRYMEDTFVLEEDKCITELYNILKGK